MTPTCVMLRYINTVKVPIRHIVIMHIIYRSLYFSALFEFLRKLHKCFLIVNFSCTMTFFKAAGYKPTRQPGFTRDTSLWTKQTIDRCNLFSGCCQ